MKPEIIYEDNHLIAAVKPQGMPSQADISGDMDILTYLKQYIKEKYKKPGDVYLGLVHRLDRPTGGVMVFARTSKAAARLSAQIKSGEFRKTYLCVCEGRPQGGVLEHFLEKDGENNISRVVDGGKNAKMARLEYNVLDFRDGLSLCEVRLMTGRPHQIRVQFSHVGHPLFGDVKYNISTGRGRLALWARRVRFLHPTQKNELIFEAPPPGHKPWAAFRAVLKNM